MDTVTIMVRPEGTADSQALGTRNLRLEYFIEHQGMWYTCPYPTLPSVQEEVLAGTDLKLCNIMKALGTSTPASVMVSVRGAGRKLFGELLPPSLQDHLRTVALAHPADGPTPVLRIHTNVNWVPWELMYDDGTDFLGVSFQVARLPTNHVFSPADVAIPSHTVASVINLLGNNVLDSSNQISQWATTFSNANVAAACEFRRPATNGKPTDFPSIGTLDSEPLQPDILHVTCHGDILRGTKVTWTLDHKNPETGFYDLDDASISEIAATLHFAKQRPLVFGNACASGTGPGSSPDRAPASFGSRFLELGAAAFIGTFAPISKDLAVDLARQFYTRLLVNGLPIGEALRATKEHYRRSPVSDPSWLFYSLYGPPELCFNLAP